MASVLLNNSPHHVLPGKLLPLVSASGICMTQNKHIKSFLNVEKENPQLPHSSVCCSRRVILALPVVSSGVTQNKHIKSFLKVEKENPQLPDSMECWSRRFILALPVVSSGLFFSYSAKGKVKINQYNEKRILEQNKKIQQANQAPKDFPNFIREGFEVKVLITDKYVKSSSGLIYLDIAVGDGDCPKDGQQVTFHYTGYNESGRRIDSTYLQGSPAKIRLGNNALVPGFEEGIHDMKPGGKRRLIIPPELGPPVGPSTFFSSKQFEVFDVELLNVKDCQRRTIAFYSDVICT